MHGKYYVISTVIILIIAALFFRFERKKPKAAELVLIAVMSALAVASRMAFAMFGNFKPSTALIMISGMAFGEMAGFLVGAIVALVSNFYFGEGAWTPWQMFALGIAGIVAGFLYRKGIMNEKKPVVTAVIGGMIIMLIVGPLLDTATLFLTGDMLGDAAFYAVYLSGLPLNAVHAAATFATLLLLAGPMLERINRIKIKYGVMNEI